MDIARQLAVKELQEQVLPTLKTGDIILTSNKGPIVFVMQLFSKKDKVNWGHVLVVKDATSAYEATRFTIKEHNLNKFFEDKKYWTILRKKDIIENQRPIINEMSAKLLGKFYDVWRLILMLFDNILNTHKCSGSNTNENIQVCSSYAAWVYQSSIGYKFNDVEWMSCDPDDIEDDVEKYPDKWEILAKRLPQGD